MRDRRVWGQYALAVALVAAATLLGELAEQVVVAPSNLVMLYLIAVVIAARYLGRGPSLLAALLGVAVFGFVFVPPRFTFAVIDQQYSFTLLGMLVVSFVISSVTSRAREHADAAARHEAQTAEMYAFTWDLAVAGERDAILQTIAGHVGRTFACRAAVLLPDAGEALSVAAAGPGYVLDETGRAAAEWALADNRPAGQGTDSFPNAPCRCLPLQTPRAVVGVLALVTATACASPSADQLRLLEVFASQAALAIERSQLAEHARQVQLLQATEKLQRALLHSISHDLRTPLVTITVALSNLETAGDRLDPATRQNLARTGRQEAERLNRLVGNLLDITRIEAGALKVSEQPCDLEEAIGVALDRLAPEGEEIPPGVAEVDPRPVAVTVPGDVSPVPMDLALMAQALVNVLDNAVKYSPEGTQIDITVCETGDHVEIRVADRGIGVPEEDLERIFDKFYSVERPAGAHGTGLGLAISKGIVEAHGGRIWAEARPGGGTVVAISLPLHDPSSSGRS